jgi:hypothetical protein
VNEQGVVTWELIEGITKHLPINKDGTNTLIKIVTRLGKEVLATKAKSFLTRIDNKIIPIRGDELKNGTYLPIMKKFPCMKYDEYYDVTRHFPKDQYYYGSEIKKALEHKIYCIKNGVKYWVADGKSNNKFIISQTLGSINRISNGEKK